jgi:hypothetical protein
MIDRHHELSISKQAKALKISRGSVYYRKCCNFEDGDGGSSKRNWTGRSQAARSNSWSMN